MRPLLSGKEEKSVCVSASAAFSFPPQNEERGKKATFFRKIIKGAAAASHSSLSKKGAFSRGGFLWEKLPLKKEAAASSHACDDSGIEAKKKSKRKKPMIIIGICRHTRKGGKSLDVLSRPLSLVCWREEVQIISDRMRPVFSLLRSGCC